MTNRTNPLREPSLRGYRSLLGLFALALLAGCANEDLSSEPTDMESGAILGGSSVPAGVRKEVGLLSPSGCTATLFSSRHFLTAAHCVNYAGSVRGGSLSLETAPNLAVDRIFSLGTNQLGQHDLAVGRLVNTVSSSVAVPATIGTAAPSYFTIITTVGFGCTNRQSQVGIGVKRYLSYYRAGNNDVLCPGDSGGPSFLGQLTSGGDLVLVSSGYQEQHFPGGDDNDFFADPGLHRNEIFALSDGLENNGICYRVHAADKGWLPTACNGSFAGTMGESRTLYAFQIWSNRPGVQVCYSGYFSNIGWQSERCDSDMAGTLGQSDKGLQALKIRLAARPGSETLSYQGHVGGIGTMPSVGENQVIGQPGSGRQLQAFAVTMTP